MEEINQNPQLAPQVYQVPQQPLGQPFKKWLIKYLLIGILGGVPVGIVAGIVAAIIGLAYLSLTTSKELAGSGAFGMAALVGMGLWFIFIAPLAWAVFLILVLYVGYRRYLRSGKSGTRTTSILWDLIFLLVGGIMGFGLNFFIFDLSGFLGFQGFYYNINLLIYPLVIVFGAYIFFKFGRLLIKKHISLSLIRHPLLWFFLLLSFLGIVGFFWSSLKKKDILGVCVKDSDCSRGLVCVGRGPTQPSVEIPGVCVSSKASQAVQ